MRQVAYYASGERPVPRTVHRSLGVQGLGSGETDRGSLEKAPRHGAQIVSGSDWVCPNCALNTRDNGVARAASD